ncbi:MAG TPA: FISUMP domain-containing protein, partial [Fibrobacteraceae bacterium]|nr:FISUMP domain-containing protein [Fibrobacteraceae bacterium]
FSCTQDDRNFDNDNLSDFAGSLTGTVVDRHGNTLSGVLITLSPGGVTTTSGAGGSFEFGNVAAGSYVAHFMKADYLDTVPVDSFSVGLLESATASAQTMTYRYATIRGTVLDSSGDALPAAGVAVELQTASTLSMSGGKFVLSQIEPGTVRIFVAKEGHGYGSVDVTTSPDDTLTEVTVQISNEGGSVSGTVVDNNGNAIEGATVSAVGGALDTLTGASGTYTLSNLPSDGSVGLVVQISGNTVATAQVQVAEGENTEVPTIVIGTGLSDDAVLAMLPATLTLNNDADTLILAATAVWDTSDESYTPYWYFWSTDGESWDTTQTSQWTISAETLTDLRSVATCDSLFCSFSIQVACAALSGPRSDTVFLTVTYPNTNESISSSEPSSSHSSSSALHSSSSATTATSSTSSSSKMASSSSKTGHSSMSKDWFNSGTSYGILTDSRDAQTYQTTIIGTQKWMAENLNYDTLDGSGSSCYEEDTSYCRVFGRLYTWTTALGVDTSYNNKSLGNTTTHKGICPEGWHVPTRSEWNELSTFVDSVNGDDSAGTTLKATTTLWSTNTGTDALGFSAAPSGYRDDTGSYHGVYDIAFFWTSNENLVTNTWFKFLEGSLSAFEEDYMVKTMEFSLRCLNDTSISTETTNEDFDWDSCVTAGTCGSFTDTRDGQSYKYTTIGEQTWMAQNLNYSGDTTNATRSYAVGWCYGVGAADSSDHSDSTTCNTYGRLYRWTDAMALDSSYLDSSWDSSDTLDHQGLCPSGWHIPTETEWAVLNDYADENNGADSTGTSLKAVSSLWTTNTGSDLWGFSALPASYRDITVWYDDLGAATYFWSATEYSATLTRVRYLKNDRTAFYTSLSTKYSGFSLRCLQN